MTGVSHSGISHLPVEEGDIVLDRSSDRRFKVFEVKAKKGKADGRPWTYYHWRGELKFEAEDPCDTAFMKKISS